MLIWLFGTQVFIPLAHSIDVSGRTAMICSVLTITAFVTLIFRVILRLGSSIEVFSSLLALRYGKRLGYDDARIIFKHIIYVAISLLLCALSWPLFNAIHPALFGLTLILVLIWISFLLARILSILFTKTSV